MKETNTGPNVRSEVDLHAPMKLEQARLRAPKDREQIDDSGIPPVPSGDWAQPGALSMPK
ncbi:hypothetical protein GCM10007901_44860 [Dyella acidisoli]|uniref:Uncharacterized protein n=1 Tax=Dyella acidisoli TaxID=1867834 RepID=A0ABQ5XUX9_9GAMM|nr:hypothetical protein GCM10007901_44860 [Dyella acidisoli]